MRKNKSLTKRNVALNNPGPNISIGTIAIVVLVGIVIYLIFKNRTAGAYQNAESWDVQYNEDGLPTKITIHRDARRS